MLFSSRVGVRMGLGLDLVSGCAHVFVLVSMLLSVSQCHDTWPGNEVVLSKNMIAGYVYS